MKTKVSKDKDIINWTEVLDTFMNNEKVVLSVLEKFIERTTAQLESLPDLEKNEDWKNARIIAHNIKGAALTISDEELGNAADRLEVAYKNIDRDEMKLAYSHLQKTFERFKKEAEKFIRLKS
jgi:HPt (histidine-containing phosphotransfer) domain-containing protein